MLYDTGVNTKFYQASTSELFGGLPGTEPQSEITPFYPKHHMEQQRGPYSSYRQLQRIYNMFVCNDLI